VGRELGRTNSVKGTKGGKCTPLSEAGGDHGELVSKLPTGFLDKRDKKGGKIKIWGWRKKFFNGPQRSPSQK